MNFNENLKWSRAVWREGSSVYSDTVLTKWIKIEEKQLFWPKYMPVEKAFKLNSDPKDKTFYQFPLVKVKVQSGIDLFFYFNMILKLCFKGHTYP